METFNREIRYLQIYGILPNSKSELFMGHWHRDRLSIFKLLKENGWKYKHHNEALYIYCTLSNGETTGTYIRKADGLQGIVDLGNVSGYFGNEREAYKMLANKAKEKQL